MFANLDQLVQGVRSSTARTYIAEALANYRAGAYRSSIISTWVAVCADLFDKIDELAAQGDKAAIELHQEVTSASENQNLEKLLRFERDIVDASVSKLQLLDDQTSKVLKRLRDDRNACAHPNFSIFALDIQPVAETCAMYIRISCENLLNNPPIQGKQLIDRLMNRVADDSFPTNSDEAYEFLSGTNYLGSAKQSAVRGFAVMLLKRMLAGGQAITVGEELQVAAALQAVSRNYPELVREVFEAKANALIAETEDNFARRAYVFVSLSHDLWSQIDNANRLRLLNIISDCDEKDLVRFQIPQCAELPEVADKLKNRLMDLKVAQRRFVLQRAPARQLKKLAIHEYINVGSFESAFEVGSNVLLPHLKFFDTEDLSEILDGALKNSKFHGINQILNAGGTDSVLAELATVTCNSDRARELWGDFWTQASEGYTGLEETEEVLVSKGAIKA
ncbi:MAG: hypothetical protein VX593_10810 [Pseudomonadota bacterium]|nr:hypothetical protein [Pseudomonadota bacterium]